MSLLKMLLEAPACLAGIVDDIEELPFPTVMYKQTGEVDSYHSNTFSDLAQMIGDDSSPSQLSSLWPTFRNYPKHGAHDVPNLTIANIEYNFPRQVLIAGGQPAAAPDTPLKLTDDDGVRC